MSLIQRCRERRRHGEEDEGFTLIELLVVLLIIGILLAIAIPTFLSITKGANGTAAQSNLQTALTGVDTYYTNGPQSYQGLSTSTTYSNISQIDTGLTFQAAASTGAHTISWYAPTNNQAILLTAYAPGQNDCWGILDIKSTQTGGAILGESAVGTYYFVYDKGAATNTTCVASTIATAPADPYTVSASSFPPG